MVDPHSLTTTESQIGTGRGYEGEPTRPSGRQDRERGGKGGRIVSGTSVRTKVPRGSRMNQSDTGEMEGPPLRRGGGDTQWQVQWPEEQTKGAHPHGGGTPTGNALGKVVNQVAGPVSSSSGEGGSLAPPKEKATKEMSDEVWQQGGQKPKGAHSPPQR